VFVVWEPVVLTDLGPPSSRTLALVSDQRAAQFWDPGRALSRELVRDLLAHPEKVPAGVSMSEDAIIWDVVALFPPGVRWEDGPPKPVYQSFPVVAGEPELMQAVRGVAVP